MPVTLANVNYQVGSPGMIATHSYKHTRQHMTDPAFVYGGSQKLWFGTACCASATGIIGDAGTAGQDFIGVFVDDEKYMDQGYYTAKSLATILTLGDIWVRVKTGLTIKPFEKVTFVVAQDAADNNIPGKFSNEAPGAGIIAVPHARFLTPNCGGIAVIGLSAWKGN